eukprot:m.437770 g.437770  ORF g.437770 m.437770 type:complete len:337 (-) comp21439_c0_seq4:1730-2740(-)
MKMAPKAYSISPMLQPSLARIACAEFLGTFILIIIGNGCVAENVLSSQPIALPIHFGYAAAVAIAVTTTGAVSAHINPAVTISLAIFRGAPSWRRVPVYCAAQVLGAFSGAAVVFALYRQALDCYDRVNNVSRSVVGTYATAPIFATYPATYDDGTSASTVTCAATEIVGTAILVAGIFALTDTKTSRRQPELTPVELGVYVGLIVFAIGVSLGFSSGYAINPARDLGPRLLTAVAGWGPDVFRVHGHYFVVPLLAPVVGAVAGGMVHVGLVAGGTCERRTNSCATSVGSKRLHTQQTLERGAQSADEGEELLGAYSGGRNPGGRHRAAESPEDQA